MRVKQILPFVLLGVLGLSGMSVWAGPANQAVITTENVSQLTQVAVLEGHTGPVFTLAFSLDGNTLISGGSGSDYTARLWDVASGSEQAVLSGHSAQIAAVGFSADGSTALTASYDATINLWDTFSGSLLETQSNNSDTGDVLSISNLNTFFSADGTRVAYTNDSGLGVYVWDIESQTEGDVSEAIPELYGTAGSIAINPDGSLVAIHQLEGPIRLLDSDSGSEVGSLSVPDGLFYLNLLAFSSDGTLLAGADYDTSAIQIWNVDTGEVGPQLVGHAANSQGSFGIYGLAFSPDNTLLASNSYDNTLRVWDVNTGAEVVSVQTNGKGGTAVAWSPDGTLLAAGDLDGSITLWSASG